MISSLGTYSERWLLPLTVCRLQTPAAPPGGQRNKQQVSITFIVSTEDFQVTHNLQPQKHPEMQHLMSQKYYSSLTVQKIVTLQVHEDRILLVK